MHRPRPITIAALATTAILSFSAGPQAAAQPLTPVVSDMAERHGRAHAIILAAVEAAGGRAALGSLTRLDYQLAGDVFNDIQGFSASRIGQPGRDSQQQIVTKLDIAGQRFAQTIVQQAESGFDSQFSTIWAGGTQYSVRGVPREYTTTANAPSPYAASGAFMVSARWVPALLLQRAAQNLRSANWVGTGDVAGSSADIVEFSFDDQVRMRLYIDQRDKLVRRVETLAPDPLSADDTSIALLSGDQRIGGIHFPTGIVAIRRGFANQRLTLSAVRVNPDFGTADFAPPSDFAEVQLPAGPPRAEHVAGRVYEVRGLAGGTYQVPFIVMDDFVVAYEAPLGIGATRQVIAEIRRIAPDKPIKYVVISHFHADHAGGIGAYADTGATILSAAANRDVLQAYAANNRSRLQGQSGPVTVAPLNFEAVPPEGREIRDANGNRLIIADIVDGHAESMLALFDPASGTFMGADHHIRAISWNPGFARTAAWIRRNRGVRLVLGTHDGPMTAADVLARASEPRGRR